MNDFESVKESVNLADYINKHTGSSMTNTRADVHGLKGYFMSPCPLCNQGTETPHFAVYPDENTWSSYCAGDKLGGTIIDFVMQLNNCSNHEALKKIMESENISPVKDAAVNSDSKQKNKEPAEGKPKKDYTRMIESGAAHVNETDYFISRGLSQEIIEKYKLGYLPEPQGREKNLCYVIPIDKNYVIMRTGNGKTQGKRYENWGTWKPLNQKYLEDPEITGKYIFIVEGAIDALSLETIGYQAMAINSTSNAKKFLKLIEENKRNLDDKVLIVVGDDDEAGQKMNKALKKGLFIQNLKFDTYIIPNNWDFNDWIIKDRESLETALKSYISVIDKKEWTVGPVTDEGSSAAANESNDGEPASPTPGVFEKDNCYCKWVVKGKGELAALCLVEITNFIIEPLEKIESDYSNKIRVNIIRKDGYKFERMLSIKNDLMAGYTAFKKALDELLIFDGKDKELEGIKRLILDKQYPTKKGYTCTGFHEVDGKWVFITGSKTIDEEFNTLDNIILMKGQETIDSTILDVEPINKDELTILGSNLFNFNEIGKVATILGCTAAMFLKEKMWREKIKFNHLFLIGESGSGKSSTIEDIVIPILNMDHNIKGADKITKFAMEKMASSTNFLPLVIDEYKPHKMRDSQLNMISDAIRNIYGNIEIEKGNKDQTVNRYTLKSPILLMGEDFGEETAATERSLRVNYSKMESKEPLRTLSYKFLKSSPDLLNKLGRALLNEALKLTPAKIKELHNNFETNSINENISTDRVRNSIANCMCGLMLIVGVFMRLKVDFEAVTGYKIKELLKAVNRTAVADTLDENHSTKSVVDLIIEKLDTFAEMGRLIKDFHYKVVDRSLMLRLPRVFDTIENDIKAKMDLSQREFSRQLMKQYYWETNQASVKMLSNKVGAEDMITVTCTKLNIDKLLERNIEIPTFSAVKPAKKNDNITKFNQVKFGSAY